MLAAEQRCRHLIDEIAPHCSLLERIETDELFASTFACAEQGPCDSTKFYEHYRQTLELRSIHKLPKTVKESTGNAFNNQQECQTVDELEAIRFKPDEIHIEALLIRERVLGECNEEYRYSAVYRGGVLAATGHYDKAVALRMYEFTMSRRNGIPGIPEDMRQFATLFINTMRNSFPVPIDALLTTISTTVRAIVDASIKSDYNLDSLLFLITILSQVKCLF
jgi:hypothetical protein